MAGKVCGDYYNQLLSQTLNGGSGLTYYLRLFQNNHTPILNEVNANFTELTTAGYAAISLTPGSWVLTDTAGVVTNVYPQQTWTLTASGSVYGYYITDAGKTKVYWAELFSGGPLSYTSAGGLVLLSIELDGPTS